MHNQALIFGILSQQPIDKIMQNFINKHTVVLENVQSYKKKDKGEVVGCQIKLKLEIKISPCQKSIVCNRLAIFLSV
jgi:hypothetical protein